MGISHKVLNVAAIFPTEHVSTDYAHTLSSWIVYSTYRENAFSCSLKLMFGGEEDGI